MKKWIVKDISHCTPSLLQDILNRLQKQNASICTVSQDNDISNLWYIIYSIEDDIENEQ